MNKTYKNIFLPTELKALIAEQIYPIKGKRDFTKLSCKYYYIIHLLYHSSVFSKELYNKKGEAISIQTLTSLFGNKRDGSEILHNLQEWNIIQLEKQYSEGNARRYKLNHVYDGLKVSMLRVYKNEASFIDKLIKRSTRKTAETNVVIDQLSALNKKVTVSDECIDWIHQKYPSLNNCLEGYKKGKKISIPEDVSFDQQDLVLISFITKDFFAERPDNESRIFTNLTSLKKEYRQFIQLDKRPLIGTDLTNSQILFSVPVIAEKQLQLKRRDFKIYSIDYYKYKDLSQQGRVYEAVAEKAGMTEQLKSDRKGFKQAFFKDLFFSKSSAKNTSITTAFKALFPFVYKAIIAIKKDESYNQFAIKCQKSESYIMLDRVYKKLLKMKIPALTLHDSIYVSTQKDAEIVSKLIDEELKHEHNIKVKTTIEDVKSTELPSFDLGKNDNVEWFTTTTGIDVKGSSVQFSNFTIYPANLKVRYVNSNKTYQYSKENLIQIIKQSENEVHQAE